MALIRATCSECGDVELRSRDLQVRICGDTGDGTYLFRCPVCRMTEVKNADDQVVDILAAAGVKCVEWRLPAEMTERPTGEPITHDDVLDFHEILGGDDWFTTLSEMTRHG
ncbi:MAG TPA: hypothetical protein PKY13_05290 [Microthrixaceae bacterium]|mgnify:CR=1|jgi:hypothetical protein|nr:hypothetical protein [Microthrixaceae bacterium]HQF93895.1 hypothetical protein [Microthrixaceae bacterium]